MGGPFIIKVGHAHTDPVRYTAGDGQIKSSQIICNDYRRQVAKSGLSAVQWSQLAESSPKYCEIAQKFGCPPVYVAISKIMADDPALCHGMPHDYEYLLRYHLGDVESMVDTWYNVWGEQKPGQDTVLKMPRSITNMDRIEMALIAMSDDAISEIRDRSGCGMVAAVIAEELVRESDPACTREDVIAFAKAHAVELEALQKEWYNTTK